MTKSVGYVTADVIDRRLPYNERGLPYSLNDRRVAYKRERGSARVWRCRLASDRRGGMDATLLNQKK